jgi:hypothetical protein
MTAFLAIAAAAIRDHWPKIVAAVLVAVALAWLAKCERAEKAADEAKVESGRREVRIESHERTLDNVRKAEDAVNRPAPGARQRVYDEQDRCARPGADCD